MDEEYSLVEADSKVFSGVLPLSTTMQHRVSCGVQAHKHRYELTFQMPAHDKEDILDVAWRCPGTGPYPRTDNMPPLPPLSEVMADSLKWDPIGARWGRGAHWPLVLGIGHNRERTPAQKRTIADTRRRKEAEHEQHQTTPALAGGESKRQKGCWSKGSWEQSAGWWNTASGSGYWPTQTWTWR